VGYQEGANSGHLGTLPLFQPNFVKLALILTALLFVGAPQSTTDQPYELKGEAPGTTLNQFKANHKHAECSNRTAHQTSCRVYEGVSFAGVTSIVFKGCTLVECGAQGILANFVDGRLVYLMYGVNPASSRQIIGVLKTKFGEPTEATERSATWRNSIGYLSVSETSIPGSDGRARNIATSVVSALNGGGQAKDI
jgi:hypothetical protein